MSPHVKQGPPGNTSQVVACFGKAEPDSPMSKASPWQGKSKRGQDRASASSPNKASVKSVLLHAWLVTGLLGAAVLFVWGCAEVVGPEGTEKEGFEGHRR